MLTSDKDHKVEVPENCEIDPPRLGEVGEVELSLRRILNLQSTKPPPPDGPEDLKDHEEWEQRDVVQPQLGNGRVLVDPGITNLLSSLRTVAWVIAALLVLILVF